MCLIVLKAARFNKRNFKFKNKREFYFSKHKNKLKLNLLAAIASLKIQH